jgi:RNA polymerase sigma-70 factor (ECF subfamily)
MADAPTEDQDLLRRIAQGDREAFHACYQQYQGQIFRFAWHMSGNQASAEEVTQEVFLRLIDKPRNFDPTKGTLAGYLFGIARHILQRQRETSRLDLPFGDESPEGDQERFAELDLVSELDRRQMLANLHKSILALPEPYREALVLCDLEELSYPHAAALLDCPPGTVASRLHRARNMLKWRLKEMGCVR